MKITGAEAIEIIDSRGNPTVSATVFTDCGACGTASVPSGASTGVHEAAELRDGDKSRFSGKGVLRACENINTVISREIKGIRCDEQEKLDTALIKLDGTENKKRLGANAILAVSLAAARAAAQAYNMELFRYIGGMYGASLPLPMMNILNGGAHAANNIDIQEFMIMPTSAESFSDGLQICCEVYASLRKILEMRHLVTSVGDEGGVAPDLRDEYEAIELICEAIGDAGYDTSEVKIALDAASSEWYSDGIYKMPKSGKEMSGEELVCYWQNITDKYPVLSIEDAAAEDDFATWEAVTRTLGGRVQLVGDDVFVTNEKRLEMGIDRKICNCILIKPNQIGTLTETMGTIKRAKRAGYGAVISHRSGETEDSFIADLAVGTMAGQIKTGAPCRGERTAKYNRLLHIEDILKKSR